MNQFNFPFRQKVTSVLILSLTLVVMSCSSSSSPSSNNTTVNTSSVSVIPKMGTTFTDSTCYKDTLLNDSVGQSLVYTLVNTNATIGGKSNVYMFTTSTIDNYYGVPDTVYLHYETAGEASGDVSIYVAFAAGPFAIGSEWVTFPFASQTTYNITPFNFVLLDTIATSGTVQGSGTETDIIAGNSLYVEKTTMQTNSVSKIAGQVPATVNVSYAPSIGIITFQNVTKHGDALGINLNGGYTTFLSSYNRK